MNTGVVSMRYAKALLAYADAQGKEDQVYEEVKTLADHYVTVPGLRRAVENPVLDIETKLQLLQEAAGGKDVSEELKRFFRLVLEAKREKFLQFMTWSYIDLYRGREAYPDRKAYYCCSFGETGAASGGTDWCPDA